MEILRLRATKNFLTEVPKEHVKDIAKGLAFLNLKLSQVSFIYVFPNLEAYVDTLLEDWEAQHLSKYLDYKKLYADLKKEHKRLYETDGGYVIEYFC